MHSSQVSSQIILLLTFLSSENRRGFIYYLFIHWEMLDQMEAADGTQRASWALEARKVVMDVVDFNKFLRVP